MNRPLIVRLLSALALIGVLTAGPAAPHAARAQGTVQVNVLGVPPVLPNPFVEDLVRSVEQGRYPVQLLYSSPSRRAATLRLRLAIEKDGTLLAETTSEPFTLRPGAHIFRRFGPSATLQFQEDVEDLIDQASSAVRRTVVRTGALPEGTYTVTVEALPEDPFIAALPGTASFTVQFAQPPVPLTPTTGAAVAQASPIFSWTPVTGAAVGAVEYDVRIVERLPRQTPAQALAANRPYLEETVQQTTLVYPPDALPLGPGTEYVWQITARDASGRVPIADEGQSEIQTFTYTDPSAPGENLAALDEIVLEPGFARLTNLDVEATERATSYALDGRATLELQFAQPIRLTAEFDALEIQKTGLDNPVLLGGAVRVTERNLTLPVQGATPRAALNAMQWRFGEGFQAEARLQLPNGDRLDARGQLRVTQSGLVGRLVAEDADGITAVGEAPLQAQLTRIEARYPSHELLADGAIQLFGEATACRITSLNLSDPSAGGAIDCTIDQREPLVASSDRLALELSGLEGSFSTDLAADTFDYDVQADAEVALTMAEAPACGATGLLQLTPGTVNVTGLTPSCGFNGPTRIDLGVFALALDDLSVPRLTYDADTAAWDFALSLDGRLEAPALPGFATPRLDDLQLTPQGLTLPALSFPGDGLAGANPLSLGGFELDLDQLAIDPLTFPWFAWDGSAAGPWSVRFDGRVQLPDRPTLPACLRSAAFDVDDLTLDDGALSGTLPATAVRNCTVPLGPSAALELDRIGGTLTGTATASDLTVTPQLDLDANLALGPPFTCAGSESLDLGDASLTLTGDGRWTGTVDELVPPCPVAVGPFTAEVTESALTLDAGANGQAAVLDGAATLTVAESNRVSGRFGLDLTTGRFTDLQFQLDDPFRWDVPADDPVFTFQIDEAEITRDAFRVDGRNTLRLGEDASVGTTFDNLAIDLYSRQIRSGRLVIDRGVALEATIDPTTNALDFRARPAGSTLSQEPGVRVDLPGTVTVDSTGLSTTGGAEAQLAFGQWAAGLDITAAFSPDFMLGLFPFGIERGLIDLQLNSSSIAYIDDTGFHPSAAASASVLPDRLPLPNENVAYLELKRNGQSLVNATTQSDGSILLETAPGESVDLVVPALQGAQGGTPRIEATFTGLEVNPSGGSFVYHSGTINAQLTGGPLDLTPLGVPMQLTEVAYGSVPVGNVSVPGLYLRGQLAVFDEGLSGDTEFILSVDGQGGITGTVNLSSLDETIELAGGTGTVALGLDAVTGTVSTTGGTSLTLAGGLRVTNDGDLLGAADVSLRATPQSVSVLQFTASGDLTTPTVDLGALRVGIDRITDLKSFAHTPGSGFSFRLALDTRIDLDAPNGGTFTIPLKGVEITEQGLHLPPQTINAGTTPQLDAQQTLTLGPVDLRLFDVELTQPVTLDWYGAPSLTGLSGLELGLGLRIAEYPALAQEELTLTDVGFSNGVFTGQLTPFSFIPGQEPTIPIGGTTGLEVGTIAGGLTQVLDGTTPTQSFDIDLTGALQLPDYFTPDGAASCPQTDITLGLSSEGRLEGTVSDFAACATMAFGPATLAFPSSTLDIGVAANGDPTASLSGQAVASIDDVNGTTITANGTVDLDLITGTLQSGSIALSGSFDVGVPANDPLFMLGVSNLTLAPSGYSITGTGTLAVGTGSVGVDFNQFTLDPQSGGIASGSLTVQSAFAFEVALQGTPDWSVVDVAAAPSTSTALRVDVPAQVTLDATGLSVDGSASAALNYSGETYASMTADFVNFGLGLTPVSVARGRVDFTTQQGTRVAYYDASGFHFDAAGVTVAVLPDRLPLPSEDVAYLQLKQSDGTPLVTYTEISGGYRLNSITDAQGNPQPLQLVLAGVTDQGTPPQVDLTLSDLEVNSTWQQVMGGSIVASADEDLSTALDIPVVLETLRYEQGTSGYALTVDGRMKLPDELGTPDVTFTDLGLTADGFQGLVEAGGTPFAETCSALPASYAPQSPVASLAYTGGGLQANPSEAQIEGADLALNLRTARLNFDPTGADTYALLGDLSSRITVPGQGQDPTQIPFILGYTSGSWTATLCTDPLPDDGNGNDKVSILLADLYLDENNGGSATLEIGNGDVDVRLSGTMRLPDVMGGSFEATVQDLTMGTSGISVAQAGGATSGQETLLFGDALKLRNDQLAANWDTQADALELSLSGSLWLTPFMCPDGNATQCQDGDAAQFTNFTVNTRGDVSLGSASANLLAGRQDPLAVIGDNPAPTLGVDSLALRKPQGQDVLALDVGGLLNLPDVAEGVSSRFLFQIDSQGQITSDDALALRFVSPSGPNDQVDARGDNPETEIDFGGVGLLDVKEAGLQFQQDQLTQPAVYANSTLYVQDGTSDLVRFGALGANTASTSGLYVHVDPNSGLSVSVNPTDVQISEIDLGGFLTLSNINVSTTRDPQRGPQFALDGTVGVALPSVNGSANWQDFTFDKQGMVSWGQPGGSLDLTIVEVVSLSIGSVDAGSGSVDIPTQGSVDSDAYFTLTNATLDLKDAISGGVDAVYYYKSGSDVYFRIDNANLALDATIQGSLSFTYENQQGNVLLSAAGSAEMQGAGSLSVAGQVGKRVLNNGDVVSSFGFFASASVNIPIIPGIVSVSDIGGGFFRYPTVTMLQDVRNQLDAFELVDQINAVTGSQDLSSTDDIAFAVYLQGGVGVISGGADAYYMSGQVVLEFMEGDFTMIAMVDEMYGLKNRIRAGMVLSIEYNPGAVEGGFVVDVDFPGIIEGTSVIAFQAYKQQGNTVWAVMGEIGPYDVLTGVASANGSFIASNDGVLLRELTVSISSPKIYVIEIEASATVSFWYVPDEVLGAYGELKVEASVVGGLARLGANLKGAYIHEEALIYMAAEGYVEVAFVFEGRIGLWVALEKGDLRGGKGKDPRYEDMVADARQQAEDMMARADEAASALDDAENTPFEFDPETIRIAGLELVSGSANKRAFDAEGMLCNDQGLYTTGCTINALNSRLSLLENLTSDLLTSPRPDNGIDIGQRRQAIQQELQELQQKATAVEQHLSDLQTQAVEWNDQAADMLADMTLGSPISQFQDATYTGSGDDRQLTASPSFTVDVAQHQTQTGELNQLRQNIEALDAQYQQSIAAASQNLNRLGDLMSGSIVFEETSWARYATTINSVAEEYATLTSDIRALFAARADSLWSRYDWAQTERTKFTSGPYRASQIRSLMDAMISDYSNGSTAGDRFRAPNVACNRTHTINRLRRSGDDDYSRSQQSQDTDDYCDTVLDYYDNGNYAQLDAEFKNAGETLWHDVPEEGLTAWSQRLRTEGEENPVAMQNVLQPIQSGHRALTQSINDLFLVKAEMATTLRGMIDTYVGWRRGTFGLGASGTDAVIQEQLDKKTALTKALRPPRIQQFIVARQNSGWKGNANVCGWMSHPDHISQVSYSVRQGSSTNVYNVQDLYSMGREHCLTLHAFAEDANQQTQDWTVSLRARGPAGNTIVRSTSFDIAVSGGGTSSAPSGLVADAGVDDTSPPSTPVVNFPTMERHTTYEQVAMTSAPSSSGLQLTSTNVVVPIERLWTNDASTLTFTALSTDAESDIAGFEYKLGTTPGGNEVRDWTYAPGLPVTSGYGSAFSNAAREITVRGITLQSDQPYYLSVRAENGDGQYSSVREVDDGIVYDATPPSQPGTASNTLDPGTPPSYDTNVGYTYPVVQQAPDYEGLPSTGSDPAPAEITARWSAAQDAESGIDAYRYAVASSADTTDAFADALSTGSTTSTSVTLDDEDGISFVEDRYVHVRAINHAGAAGPIRTIGPFRPVDPTAPRHPHPHAMAMQDGIRIYLPRPAADRESGIEGYQYAIARQTAQGYFNGWERPFPTDGSVDFEPPCSSGNGVVYQVYVPVYTLGSGGGSGSSDPSFSGPPPTGCSPAYSGSSAPYVFIPNENLPTGTSLYVHLRALNQQGHRSKYSSTTGPIVLDASPPHRPSVTASFRPVINGSGSTLSLDVSGVHDPESGVRTIEYGLKENGSTTWYDYATLSGLATSSQSYSRTFSGPSSPGSEVGIRITNGSGLQRVSWHCMDNRILQGNDCAQTNTVVMDDAADVPAFNPDALFINNDE